MQESRDGHHVQRLRARKSISAAGLILTFQNAMLMSILKFAAVSLRIHFARLLQGFPPKSHVVVSIGDVEIQTLWCPACSGWGDWPSECSAPRPAPQLLSANARWRHSRNIYLYTSTSQTMWRCQGQHPSNKWVFFDGESFLSLWSPFSPTTSHWTLIYKILSDCVSYNFTKTFFLIPSVCISLFSFSYIYLILYINNNVYIIILILPINK